MGARAARARTRARGARAGARPSHRRRGARRRGAARHIAGNSLGGDVALQERIYEQTKIAAPRADAILATPEGRRRATQYITVRYEHIPVELLTHRLLGVAACDTAPAMIAAARRTGWPLDAERVTCPLRIVWGAEDRLLLWPAAAERCRAAFPNADWIVLDGVGHCPQLDARLEAAQLILGFTD